MAGWPRHGPPSKTHTPRPPPTRLSHTALKLGQARWAAGPLGHPLGHAGPDRWPPAGAIRQLQSSALRKTWFISSPKSQTPSQAKAFFCVVMAKTMTQKSFSPWSKTTELCTPFQRSAFFERLGKIFATNLRNFQTGRFEGFGPFKSCPF